MTAFLLSAHILCILIGFGPTFAFAFIGMLAEREPAHANLLVRLTHTISTRLVIPFAILAGIFGLLLFFNVNLDLTKNIWLGVSIGIYVLVVGVGILIQTPGARRMIELTKPDNLTPEGIAEAQRLAKRSKLLGIGQSLGIVAIVILMAWKPGLTM